MPDSEENGGFDVEAQESLLEPSAEEEVPEAETSSSSNARKTLMKFILLVRSTERFKLSADYAADVASSASYAPIPIFHENGILTQFLLETYQLHLVFLQMMINDPSKLSSGGSGQVVQPLEHRDPKL